MARPLRIEGPHFWYHVYNRGNEKRTVFHDDDDRRLFLDLLFESSELFNAAVHAYALMPNHFHLLLVTREANLGAFMQRFQNKFIKHYNARHDRVGHIFQDRYKAIVIDSQQYSHELSRYIHLNIARYHDLRTAPARQRLAALRTFPWSSYRAYIGLEPSAWPLTSSTILADFGDTPAEQQAKYARYVRHGLLKEFDPYSRLIAGSILGSEDFARAITSALGIAGRKDSSAAPKRRRVEALPLDLVLNAVASSYGIASDVLLTRHRSGPLGEARHVLFWAAVTYAAGRLSRLEIGRQFGGIGSTAVSHGFAYIEARRDAPGPLRDRLDALIAQLDAVAGHPARDPWLEMYQRLAAYYQRYGHTLIPHEYPPDLALGAWVHRQRLVRAGKAHNAKPLTQRQIDLLDQLHFAWTLHEHTGKDP